MSANLSRRLDRLDGGLSRNLLDMSDTQLLRLALQGAMSVSAFLALLEVEQDRLLDDIARKAGGCMT